MGGEMGAVVKPAAEFRFVLAFPDVYEVGMSHLGLKILYTVLNNVPWIAAERAFAPWPDMETTHRRDHIPLTSLESGRPLATADVIGFTLQYELSYTNILNMLELAGIPLLASERNGDAPLVIGGGPCASNPEPLADFFDAFVLGDGEEVVLEIAEVIRSARCEGVPRSVVLERLAEIKGVYVPSFFSVSYHEDGRVSRIEPLRTGYERVQRRYLADIETSVTPTAPVVPFMKTVHDRVSIEIARGCTRGCRFCQAGYIYRPVRERSPERILASVSESLKNSGHEEISLLSLSTGDYCQIEPLLKALMKRHADDRIAVSLPSLRVGTLTRELVEEIRKVRKTGFTLAPEAGSDRLRKAINKGISEEDLLDNAYGAYSAGWRLIKLYFMIGLPGEADDDILAIADLSRKVKGQGKRTGKGGEVNVAISTFVPKSHTPYQWEPQIGESEIVRRQQLLRQELRRGKLNFKWHDSHLSLLEGVFARGDRRLGRLIMSAHALGCRFDGWGEHYNAQAWKEAFAETGIDPAFYLRRRETDEVLPWDHLDFGVTKAFLLHERGQSDQGLYTEDCRSGQCSGCGVCDFDQITMRQQPAFEGDVDQGVSNAAPQLPAQGVRIRLRFEKLGVMRLLSHLEMLTLFSRAVNRAAIPIRFSQGFHPHPKFSFATALSVGVESYAEYMDMEIAPGFGAQAVMSSLNQVLPAGMRISAAEEIPLNSPSLSVIIEAVRYRVTVPEQSGVDLSRKATEFLALDSFPWRREKRGKVAEFDLRHELRQVSVRDNSLEIVVGRGKPLEFVSAMTGIPIDGLAGSTIEKLEVIFSAADSVSGATG
jgi:radical SAM family uncharacterized protein/radical SAM-linked protein